jgi:hypothetical protein
MIQPIIKGEVFRVESSMNSYVDKETGRKREYERRAVELVCSEPERGVARIMVIGDGTLTAGQGDKVAVLLSSFSIDRGVPMLRARAEDFVVESKAGAGDSRK